MWREPIKLVDAAGGALTIIGLEDAALVLRQRWQRMPPAERAAAYRAIVVEANGGAAKARAALKTALLASGLHEA